MVSFECRLKPYISTGQTSMTTRLPKRNINAHVSSIVFNIHVVITDSTQWLHNTCGILGTPHVCIIDLESGH